MLLLRYFIEYENKKYSDYFRIYQFDKRFVDRTSTIMSVISINPR